MYSSSDARRRAGADDNKGRARASLRERQFQIEKRKGRGAVYSSSDVRRRAGADDNKGREQAEQARNEEDAVRYGHLQHV